MGLIGKPKVRPRFDIDSFSHCKNITGAPQIFGSSQMSIMHTFVFWCNFIIGRGKPKLLTKFEVASFSHYRNIKRNPQILGSSLSPGLRPLFLLGVSLWLALANLKFDFASFSHCVNIEEEPANFGSSPSPGPRPLFHLDVILWWDLAISSCRPILRSLVLAIAEILNVHLLSSVCLLT